MLSLYQKLVYFFIQYVTLVTASNVELFFTIIMMYSQMKLFFYQILSIMMFEKSKSGAVMK